MTAYKRVFSGGGTTDDVKLVNDDLARFCRASETTHNPDARLTDMLNGRREVWLRIQDHLLLTLDDFYERYAEGKKR